MDPQVIAGLISTGLGAGFLGSLFGVGGGVVLIPFLTLFFHYSIKTAVALSLTTIVATSTMSSSIYYEKKLVNVKVALRMVPIVILGAITGTYVNKIVTPRYLELLFSLVLLYTSYEMVKGNRETENCTSRSGGDYSYFDEALGERIYYTPRRIGLGSFLSFFTGFLSALLGIGGGVINIPILNIVMGVPLRICMATNLMIISLSTSTSATIYALRGLVSPFLVSLLITGVIVGVLIGTRVMVRTRSTILRYLFASLLVIEALKMLQRGLAV